MKNYTLKIEASALKIHVKCELSTIANKTETMSLNLWKTVNTQQKNVNKTLKYYNRIKLFTKKITSKYETIKSLLEVRSALIVPLNKPTVNEFYNGASTKSANANF